MSDLISVIVPIYNVERYIEQGIKAICEQTYRNLEIILIDDGSTDSSGKFCDEFAKKDKRIQVHHISNSGQSHARNVGLSKATGNWIGFIDGDDYPLPDMYERLHTLAVKHNVQIAECNFVGRNSPPPDQIEEGKLLFLSGKEALKRQIDLRIPSRYPSTSVWSKLFSNSVLEGITFPDGLIHEEYAMLSEAFLNCEHYLYINEILYNRTLRSDSTTKEKFSPRSLDKLKVHKMRNEFLEAQDELELLLLSREQEYNLLLHFYNQTMDNGLEEEKSKLEEEIDHNKKAILKSKLPIKKKLSFYLLFFNKGLFKCIRDLSKKGITKKQLGVSFCIGLFMALFTVFGYQMEEAGRLTFSVLTFFILILLAILYPAGLLVLYQSLEKREKKKAVNEAHSVQKKAPPFFLIQGIMIFCWIPVLLAGYPGFFCYDAADQLKQVTEGIYSVHHPLFHTLLLGKTIQFFRQQSGSYELGVLIYCVLQMFVTTAIFTKILLWIHKRKVSKKLFIFAFCFYSFYPTIVLFGLCTTKDSLFTAITTLSLLYLYEVTKKQKNQDTENGLSKGLNKESKKRAVIFFCLLTFSFLLRNNGIYMWTLFLVVFFIVQRKKSRFVLCLSIPAMILSIILNSAAAFALNAENKDGFREMLSIPAQQLARVYDREGESFFAEEDIAQLFSFIPEGDIINYREKLSDPVKANLKVGMNSSIIKFGLFWVKTGLRAPELYTEAFLMQTYQVWYPLSIPDGYCGEGAKPRYQESASCYFAFDQEEPVTGRSLLPGLGEAYRLFSRQMTFDTIPVIPVLFSIGTVFWLHLILGGYAIYMNKKGASTVFLLLLCSVLTCMLGPITLVRYYLILYYSLPLLAAVCLGRKEMEDNLH